MKAAASLGPFNCLSNSFSEITAGLKPESTRGVDRLEGKQQGFAETGGRVVSQPGGGK